MMTHQLEGNWKEAIVGC